MATKLSARVISGVTVLSLLFVPLLASSQEKRKGVRGQGNIRVNEYDGRSGGGSTDLGIAEIEGRIFKPSVFFVLARKDFQYQAIAFRQSFVDRVVEGAVRRPF